MGSTTNNRELENQQFLDFLTNSSTQFLNFALKRDQRLDTLFKNAQISTLKYTISIDSENSTYFISLDKTYVVRFFHKNFFVYHVPTGKRFSFSWISWSFCINPRKNLDYETVTQLGEFLPLCYHPKVKQTIFEKKIKNGVINKQDKVNIKFHLNCRRDGPIGPASHYLCFADNLYIDLYQ